MSRWIKIHGALGLTMKPACSSIDVQAISGMYVYIVYYHLSHPTIYIYIYINIDVDCLLLPIFISCIENSVSQLTPEFKVDYLHS